MAVASAVVAGVTMVIETVSAMNDSSANRDVIRANEKSETRDAKLTQREDIGRMRAKTAGSGLSLDSFEDIFNNQTMEDARQLTGIKQKKEDAISADRNEKTKKLIDAQMKAAASVAGAMGGGGGGGGTSLGSSGATQSGSNLGGVSGKIAGSAGPRAKSLGGL